MSKEIILKKGEEIKFLDYTIRNSENSDGLILYKEGPDAKNYESHLGNYGPGDKDSVDNAKQAALVHFMLARPEEFSRCLMKKIMSGSDRGSMDEWYTLKNCLLKEKIYTSVDDFPEEIRYSGDGMNCMIYFNDKPIAWIGSNQHGLLSVKDLLNEFVKMINDPTYGDQVWRLAVKEKAEKWLINS